MRFTTLRSNVTSRISLIRSFHESIKRQEASSDLIIKTNSKISKGLFFVELYGIWEYTVHTTLQSTNNHLTSLTKKCLDVKPQILSLAMNPQFNSLRTIQKKKWEKRIEILSSVNSNSLTNLTDYVDVTMGKNIRYSQLQNIWECYGIPLPILPADRMIGRLEELVNNRNEIAHGRGSASDVGRRYTQSELLDRLNDMDMLCFSLISKLEQYCANNEFER